MITKKPALSLAILFLASCVCPAQELVFANKISHSAMFTHGLSIVGSVISQDKFYLAGTFRNTISIDSVSIPSTCQSNWYDCNSAILKYNELGELTQYLSNTGTGIFTVTKIRKDQAGNIFITARTEGSITLGPLSFSTDSGILFIPIS